MDKKTYELIALGSSIAANCQTWFKYHVGAAREAGANIDEIKTAVGIGEMVREKTKENMSVMVNNVMSESETKGVQNITSNSGCGWSPEKK